MAAAPAPNNATSDKPRGMDIYTVMLLLSLLFLLVACIALGTEFARYGYELKPGVKLF
jgi:hypothetical protein